MSCPDDHSLCHHTNNSSCYPSTQRCVYQTYQSNPLYCPGLEHLYHCDEFECPTMYKCPGTYCIPTRMLCDQSPDCPNKEDEQDCQDNLVCPGLLRCREENICVHPDDICDGILHCLMTGDDEMFCNITECPDNCVFHGSTAKCNGTSDNRFMPASQIHLTALIMNGFSIQRHTLHYQIRLIYIRIWNCTFISNGITSSIFSKLHNLKFLYIILSHIEYIQAHAFSKLQLLEVLEIKNNQIHVLMNQIFNGLQLLPFLDLSQLSIRSLQSEVFSGLINVKYLNLSLNSITRLDDFLFTPLHNLRILDLRHTKLSFIGQHSLSTLSPATIIYLDYPVLCCYLSCHHRCHVHDAWLKEQHCKQLISTKVTYTVVALSAIANIVLNFANIILLQKRNLHRSQIIVLEHLSFTNILPALYLLVVCIASSLYSNDYIYIHTKWLDSYVCNFLYSLPSAGYTFSRCCAFLIVLDQLLATKFALKHRRISTLQLLGILYSYMLIGIIWHILKSLYMDITNDNCYPFSVGPSDSVLAWADRVQVIVISMFVIISTSCMYYAIVRTVQKSSAKIRSTRRSNNTVASIVQHAVGIVGIEVLNLLSIAILLLLSFYSFDNKPTERSYVLISVMTLLNNSSHVVFFGYKQHKRNRRNIKK